MLQPGQRYFALRFQPFAEEINSNGTGKEVNLNSKLGQPPQRAFSLPPGARLLRKQPSATPVPRGDSRQQLCPEVTPTPACSIPRQERRGTQRTATGPQAWPSADAGREHVTRCGPTPPKGPKPVPSPPPAQTAHHREFLMRIIRFCLVCFTYSCFSFFYYFEEYQIPDIETCYAHML